MDTKRSINNTFRATKVFDMNANGEKVNERVIIKGATVTTTGIMFPGRNIRVITGDLTVEQFTELSDFLQWVDKNFWNI